MGRAVKWQQRFEDEFEGFEIDVDLYNPRGRETYDEADQSMAHESFEKQVDWEQHGLETADLIIMYFDKDAMSPISLLELGQFAGARNMIVCCSDGYWRKGNVDYITKKYHIPTAKDLDELIIKTKDYLKFVKTNDA